VNELDVRTVLLWIVVVLLFVVHFVLHIGFSYGRGAPDLLTLGLLIAARETSLGRASVLGLSTGLLEDAMSVLAFGANSIAMTIVAVGGAITRDLFVGDSRHFLPAYVFVGKWTRDLVHWIGMGSEVRQPFVEQVVLQGAIGSVYVAGIALVMSWVLGAWGEA
jgi:cell shape-determining protein MreD